MARRKYWTQRKKAMFFDVLSRTANVSAAARAVGAPKNKVYELRKKDDEFRAGWELALQEAMDDLEAELRRRAMEGVEKPVYFGGKECGAFKTYSDQLGIFLLKRHRGEENLFVRADESDIAETGRAEKESARGKLLTRLAELRHKETQ